MLLEALLKGAASEAGSSDGETPGMANLLPDREAAEKIKRYQDFLEKKLQP